ncbi:MAG: SBBP repeat-containing protein [Bryobacteraceae bacterium]|nr:SBBP repeat-containing protein [Bryobacteraceae bacterium]
MIFGGGGVQLRGIGCAGAGALTIQSMALDSSGNLYLTGLTQSPDFPATEGALQGFPNHDQCVSTVASHLHPDAGRCETERRRAVVYSIFVGGREATQASHHQYAGGIAVDADGNAYVPGVTATPDFPVTSGAFMEEAPEGQTSAFVAKLNRAGSELNGASALGTSAALAVDAEGNAVVLGNAAAGFPVTSGAAQPCMAGGGSDLFVARVSPAGRLEEATYLGGSSFDWPFAVAANEDRAVHVAGATAHANFVATLRLAESGRSAGPCLSMLVQNAASFAEIPVAAGEIVSLRGEGIGPESPVSGSGATELGDVRVFFDGMAAPLLYAQSQQINAIVPWKLAGRETADARVEYAGASSIVGSVPVAPSAPGIFQIDYDRRQAAVVNADGTLYSPETPAEPGSIIAVFGTGGGPMEPGGVTGGVWPLSPLARLVLPVTVEIGGVEAEVPESPEPSPAGHDLEVKIGAATAAPATVSIR